jgi:hypothetical protein
MNSILTDTVTNGGTPARQTLPLSPNAAELLNDRNGKAAEEVAAQQTELANSTSNDPAKRGDRNFPLHPSRKRRRAETIAPSCPL